MERVKRLFVVGMALWALQFVWTAGQAGADGPKGPGVAFFNPQGEARQVRQVTARFTEEMVSFGDPRLDDPFHIECSETGKGRWVDGKNWVYDFDRDLRSGVRCTFSLKEGLRTSSGKELSGEKRFAFSTGGPQVSQITPGDGTETLNEDQAFVLRLDGEADEASVASHLFCYLGATREKVGVRIVKGAERASIIGSAHRYDREKKPDVLVVRCSRPLPHNSAVDLIWSKGVRSKSGLASTTEQVFHYRTRGPFSATFHCDRENPKAQCSPLLPMSIVFSAPVLRSAAARISMKGGGKLYRPRIADDIEEVARVEFKGPFPEKTSFVVNLPQGIRDDAGRSLINRKSYPLNVRTDRFPPLARFSSRFGIIESSDPVLPVTVRNIEPSLRGRVRPVPGEQPASVQGREASPGGTDKTAGRTGTTHIAANVRPVEGDLQIIEWLQKVASVGRSRSILKEDPKAKRMNMPLPLGQKAFEVIGIPFRKSGLYVVELESNILGAAYLHKARPMYVHTAALVTNLSAHFKRGRETSLVWVTTLDKGAPVADARVAIRDCRGTIYWEGRTDGSGIARIDKPLPTELPWHGGRSDDDAGYDYSQIEPISQMGSGLFVFVKTADDMTFVHSSWDKGIESYRFKLGSDLHYHSGDLAFHTIFDRTLFRAGETVHLKSVARRRTKDGLSLPGKGFPGMMVIRHLGSDQKYTLPLAWNTARGSAENLWEIPKDARLGLYGVSLEEGDRVYDAGEFRVEEFKLPLMKASIKPLVDTLVNVPRVEVDVMAEYLSGGGAKGLPVKVRAQTQPKQVAFEEYEHFTLSRGTVKEGVSRRESGETYDDETDYPDEQDVGGESRVRAGGTDVLKAIDLTLGDGGMARTAIENVPRSETPFDLATELEFKDPNGKVVTISKTIPVWPSRVIVGVETEDWVHSGEPFTVKALALDLSGKPVAGVPVKIRLFQKKHYSHRKRLVGGFYAYERTTEIKKVSSVCEGSTNAQGLLLCEANTPLAGNFLVEAVATDGAGNMAGTSSEVWVSGKEQLWFDPSNSDRIDLLPDKRTYEPGETALFQVRMPMREATALITVEREGIIDAFVTTLSGKEPIIQVPIKATYSPNIFVSALCVRGRTQDAKPTPFVDLAKPTFKLGISAVSVGWRPHELKVKVTPDRKVYRTRDRALFRVQVNTADGRPLPKGSEVAFAVVDEALLELMANASWNLLEAMMQKRGYAVETSTAQMQVVGRRHYGLKALPFGGGGGRQATRELFDTLLLWKGSVVLDDAGEASIEVPLNDALTSFTAVAVATAGKDLFGTGRTSIRSTQDLMVLSGLSDVAREGDRTKAVFTIRNTTDRAIRTETSAKITDKAGSKELPVIRETLEAGTAKEIVWDVSAPSGAETMQWEVQVKETEGTATDRLKVSQKVVPAVKVRLFQASIGQVEKQATVPVEKPADAMGDKGGVRLLFTPRLSDDVSGIVDYMAAYPFTCMEQKLSKAIALQDKTAWQRIVRQLPSYLDRDGLVKYFPAMNEGSDVLTSYILSITAEAGWEMPADLEERLKNGLAGFVRGRLRRESPMARADLSVRKLAAVEALSRYSAATASDLESIDVTPSLWPTSAVIDWTNILARMDGVPERNKRLQEAGQIIRTRLNLQGTHMGFSTEKNDYLWWLMVNGDVNAIRTVLTFMKAPQWKDDMPRLFRGALGRQRQGRWLTTVANAWGRLALKRFSEAYEGTPVSGHTRADLGREEKSVDWSASNHGGSLVFGWPQSGALLKVTHEGAGKPWMTVQSLAAIPLKAPLANGYRIRKTYTPVEKKRTEAWSIGDVVRVRLEIEAQTDMTWVALTDPIPAGASILGTGLGRDSTMMTAGEKQSGWAWPAFEERSFEAFRAYYHYVPKGAFSLEYTMRINTAGTFVLPETRCEALYVPEMFGEIPNGPFRVE